MNGCLIVCTFLLRRFRRLRHQRGSPPEGKGLLLLLLSFIDHEYQAQGQVADQGKPFI